MTKCDNTILICFLSLSSFQTAAWWAPWTLFSSSLFCSCISSFLYCWLTEETSINLHQLPTYHFLYQTDPKQREETITIKSIYAAATHHSREWKPCHTVCRRRMDGSGYICGYLSDTTWSSMTVDCSECGQKEKYNRVDEKSTITWQLYALLHTFISLHHILCGPISAHPSPHCEFAVHLKVDIYICRLESVWPLCFVWFFFQRQRFDPHDMSVTDIYFCSHVRPPPYTELMFKMFASLTSAHSSKPPLYTHTHTYTNMCTHTSVPMAVFHLVNK